MRHGIIGAMVLLLGGPVQDADARPNEVCEQWRDYHYNALTGEFIEWVGEPYWVCLNWSDPVSYPRSPAPDRYSGGTPFPHEPTPQQKCNACDKRYGFCMSNIQHGVSACKKHYYGYYEDICSNEKQNRDGSRIKPDMRCYPAETPTGKPVEVCFDRGVHDCVMGYERDWPSITRETREDLELGAHFAGVVEAAAAAGGSTTMSWPSGTGYRTMCNNAGRNVSQTCLETRTECKRRLRGCR